MLKVSDEMLGRRVRCRCGQTTRFREDQILVPVGQQLSSQQPSSQQRSGQQTLDQQDSSPQDPIEQIPEARILPAHSRQASVNGNAPSEDDVARVKAVRESYRKMCDQLSQAIVGQQRVIEEVLISLFCRGHVLLVGVPGLAKTMLVSSIAEVLDLQYRRIQFTPDLMPADITGTEVLQEDRTTGKRNFQFVEGPVFANMVLADEINRAPPKTQASLLEAMQERHVTVGDQTYELPSPFFVMATQNPIEQEGTYPLPEAQLDRFLFNIVVDYPDRHDEFDVIKQATSDWQPALKKVLDHHQIKALQQTVRRVPAADHVIAYARDLVQATRPNQPETPDFINEFVGWGAGPRAGISLIMAAKARAVLHGRFHATTADVRHVMLPVLRHRVVTTFNAEAAGVKRDDVIEMLAQHVHPNPPASSSQRAPSHRGNRVLGRG